MTDLTEDMLKLFTKENLPKTDTELNIWKIIESLGGISWRMNHDAADGRISFSSKDEEFISNCRCVQEGLIEILKTKYNVIPPQECPIVDFGQTRPTAPKGKVYYWDWCGSMVKEHYTSEYEKIICSACALHENDGVEKMRSHVPCDVYPGIIYQLDHPWECAMLQLGHSTRGVFWTEEKLFEEIKKKGGEASLKRFKQKITLLKECDS